MVADLQRPDPSRLRALPARISSACANCRNRRACAPQNCMPRSSSAASRNWASSAAISIPIRPAAIGTTRRSPTSWWYPLYEKMVELDVPAMVHVSALLQSQLPHHRRALHQRRHHRLHAVHPSDLFKDFPTLQVHHSAWRRRGAVPLGPLSRAGAGHEAAAARANICSRTSISIPASITSRGSIC